MGQEIPVPGSALKKRHFNTDKMFRVVNDPCRRHIIRALAVGGMKTAFEINGGSGKKRHAYLKHFTILCKAGVIVRKENPKDARKPLFALSPHATVCRDEKCFTVDFGGCALPFV